MTRIRNIVQKLFIIVTVPLASLSATFILMYTLLPRTDSSVVQHAEVSSAVDTVSLQTGSVPVQMSIAAIDVAAIINPVGLTSEGDMAIDENPEQIAWYKFGPKPGELGSAVVAGHYGWKNGVPSIFNDLNTLVKGDEISILGENGQLMTFVVTRTAIYMPDQDATDVFKSDDGKAHLNLITCQGSWNKSLDTYSERLVVFTDFVK